MKRPNRVSELIITVLWPHGLYCILFGCRYPYWHNKAFLNSRPGYHSYEEAKRLMAKP